MKTPRWETFSDAVFAIAITLLILEIRVPHEGDLARGLVALWPSFAAYIASFLYVGTWWMAHHLVGDQLRAVDGGALLLNVVFLMTISFIPFPTALLADRLATGLDTGIAAAFYAGSTLTTALTSIAFSEYALRRGLYRAEIADLSALLRYRWLGPVLYALAIPLGLALPLVALVFFVVGPGFYGVVLARRRYAEGA